MEGLTSVTLGTCVFESEGDITVRPLTAAPSYTPRDGSNSWGQPAVWMSCPGPRVVDDTLYLYGGNKVCTQDNGPIQLGAVTLTERGHMCVVCGHVTVQRLLCLGSQGVKCMRGARLECPSDIIGPDVSACVPVAVPYAGHLARIRYGSFLIESTAALRMSSVFRQPHSLDVSRRALFDVADFAETCMHVRGQTSVDLETQDVVQPVWQAILHDGAYLCVSSGCVDFKYGIVCARGSRGVSCIVGAEIRLPCLLSSNCFNREQDRVLDFAGCVGDAVHRDCSSASRTSADDSLDGCACAAAAQPSTLRASASEFVPARATAPHCHEELAALATERERDEEEEEEEEEETEEEETEEEEEEMEERTADVDALTVAHLEESLAQSEENYVRACALWARNLSERMTKHLAHCSLRRELRACVPDTEPEACATAALDSLEEEIHALDAAVVYYQGVREEAHDEMIMDESILAALLQ